MYEFHKRIDDVDFYAPSTRKHKKYDAFVGRTKYSFGDDRYQQFNDKIGFYKHLNHNDNKRRKNYRSRHKNTNLNEFSPGYFSMHYLW